MGRPRVCEALPEETPAAALPPDRRCRPGYEGENNGSGGGAVVAAAAAAAAAVVVAGWRCASGRAMGGLGA